MNVEQILRWIILAVVLLVAIWLLDIVLALAWGIMKFIFPVLLILLIVAVVLRFVSALGQRRRY